MSRVRSRAPDEPDAQVKQILAARAERLRAPISAAQEQQFEWVAEFGIGDERYAIVLSALRAAVPLRRVTTVPLSRPHVVGILRFQGQIITALSTASLLGVQGWSHDPSILLVVDPGWGRLVALDCEEIPRPIGLSMHAIEQTKARGEKGTIEVVHQGRLVHLIDLGRFLDRRTGERSG